MSQDAPTISQALARSAFVGGIAYLGAAYVIGGDGVLPLPFLGDVSGGVAVGVAVGTASFAGGVAARYVIPLLRQTPQLQGLENRALQPAMTGAASLLVGKMLGDVPSPLMLLAFGAACEVGGEYAAAAVLPMLGMS